MKLVSSARAFTAVVACVTAAVFPLVSMAKPGMLDDTYGSFGIANTTSLIPKAPRIEAIAVGDDTRFFLPCRLTQSSVNYDNVCELWLSNTGTVGFSTPAPSILTNLNVFGVYSHAIDPRNGSVVIATLCRAPGMANDGYCIMRYNAAGGLDNSFNNSNRFIGVYIGDGSGPMLSPGQMQIAHDGRIRIAGACATTSGPAGTNPCVIGLTDAGLPDPTFKNGAIDGVVTFPSQYVPPIDAVRDLLIRPDGTIITLGNCSTSIETALGCISTVSSSGVAGPITYFKLDFGFSLNFPQRLFPLGSNQYVVAGVANPNSGATRNIWYRALQFDGTSIQLLPQLWGNDNSGGFNGGEARFGQKFVYGHDRNIYEVRWDGSDAITTRAEIRRVNGDGTGYDLGFGDDTGVARINNEQTRPGAGFTLRADGKLVMGGANFATATRFVSARFTNGLANRNLACSLDVDGDGRFLSSTDGLLLARFANGNTGTAATQGAIGAGAARNNWAAIRDHLFYRCGIRLAP